MFNTNSPVISWRNSARRYRLEGVQCDACNKQYYPKAYRCSCSNDTFTRVKLARTGRLISFSQVTITPAAYASHQQYCIGLIQLDNGPRLFAQLTDVTLEQLSIGMKVQVAFRKYYESGPTGIIHYGMKFKPL